MRHVTGHANDLSAEMPTGSSLTADVLISVTLPNPQSVVFAISSSTTIQS
jgi:hypothetical protein